MSTAPSTPDMVRKERNLRVLRQLESIACNELARLAPLYEPLPATADWQLVALGWDLGLDAATLLSSDEPLAEQRTRTTRECASA